MNYGPNLFFQILWLGVFFALRLSNNFFNNLPEKRARNFFWAKLFCFPKLYCIVFFLSAF